MIMRSLTPGQRLWLIVAFTIATLIKLYLAAKTHGTTDVAAYTEQLNNVRQFGAGTYYIRGSFGNAFNHPPPMIHVLKALGFLTDISGVPFRFWLRLLPTLADIGSVLLVSSFLENRKERFLVLLALALSPISIIINGYHGNTDGLMIAFVVLSIYLTQCQKSILLGGVAFGMACSVKVVPVLFVPALIVYLPDFRSRVKFSVAAVGFFLVSSLPYIAQEPITIVKSLFGYGSIYGSWGFSQLLAIFSAVQYAHQPYEPLGIHGVVASILKYLTLLLICTVSVWMNFRKTRPSLLTQCGTVMSLFLFLTPGFGPQYLVWLVPFVAALGFRAALACYCVGGLYLAYKYLGFTESISSYVWPIGLILSLSCWLLMYFFVRQYVVSVRLSNS
jgi:hypothetical protein